MNILHLLFPWLLASSLRASILALAIICLQAGLGRWLPARQRYILWLPVLLVLLAPVLPASRWSIQNYFARKPAPLATADVSPATSGSLSEHASLQAPSPTLPPPSGLAAADLLPAAWLLGATTILAAGIFSFSRTLRRFRATRLEASTDLTATIASISNQLGLRRPPPLLISTGIESPAVAGLFRPILLLPARFSDDFTPAEARLVLLHEFTHLKAGDLPLNWLLCFLQALHWFNPALWLAFARIRADREVACDATVLSSHSLDCRADYGRALLKLQAGAPRLGLSLAFVGMFERAGIRSRIRAIGRHRRAHPAWSIAAAALIAALLLIGATRAQSAGPVLLVGSNGPQIELDAQIIETPANLPLNIRGEKTPATIGSSTPSTAYTQSPDVAAAFIEQLMSTKRAHIIAKPRITDLSGRRAIISMGNEWTPAPKAKPILLGDSININPTVAGPDITLDIAFSQTKLLPMQLAKISAPGQVIHAGTAEATGTLVIQMPPDGRPPATPTGSAPRSVPVQAAITSTVTSKVALKDGQSVVLAEPEAGFGGGRLIVLITAHLLPAAPTVAK